VTPAEPATTDLVAITRQIFRAFSTGELERGLGFYAPDAVYESAGLGTVFDGLGAIRGFMEDWTSAYEDFEMRPETVVDLGVGATLSVVVQHGRPVGSSGQLEWRFAAIGVWKDGVIARVITYTDIEEARAAAERLTRERGSENLEIVRAIYAEWERGDFRSHAWAHPEIEVVAADGAEPGTVGQAATKAGIREFLSAWDDFRIEADEYRDLGDHRVLVLDRRSGRGKTSGLDLAQMRTDGARLFEIHDGNVTRIVIYLNRDRALADLDLIE